MILQILLLIMYILFSFVIFLKISYINKSYFSSWTSEFASAIIIRLIPFMLSLSALRSQKNEINILIFILYMSTLMKFVGYIVGHRIKIKQLHIPPQIFARRNYGNYLVCSLTVMVIAFILLATSGVGLYEWIFNNRTAYIVGRNGKGVYYVLFELGIVVSMTLIMCRANYYGKKKKYLLIIIPLIAAYFTGSKGYFISSFIFFLFFWNTFEKKISFGKLIKYGILGLLAICILLRVQSKMTLTGYSDYYTQFLKFIKYVEDGKWEFGYGNILLSDIFWKLIPRSLVPSKPYIYGEIKIVNVFYSYESIAAGNTPSFSEFAVPFADFGIIGIIIYFFVIGLLQGTIERAFRDSINRYGCNFNAIIAFALLYICRPVNFSLLYIILFIVLFYFLQTLHIHFKIGVN